MLPLPIGLFAKTLVTAAAVGAVCYGGYCYRREIVHFYDDVSGKFRNLMTPSDRSASSLSLPSGCALPADGSRTCADITTDQIKNINFFGKGEGSPTVEGNSKASLTIEKLNSESDFPRGFKFSFSSADSNEIVLKKSDGSTLHTFNSTPVVFRIKEEGGIWYLEKKTD